MHKITYTPPQFMGEARRKQRGHATLAQSVQKICCLNNNKNNNFEQFNINDSNL